MKSFLMLTAGLALAGPAGAQTPAPPGPGKPSAADSAFMTGMIGHHAQAIVMANLAPSRVANGQVRILADRIIVSQRDEILAMETWLRQHGLPVPDSIHRHHEAAMPGMLSSAQMKELEQANGPEFDRLFVTLMMQHHNGALVMVDQLLQSPGAHDSFVYRFAADVHADQSAEIERMARLLVTLPLGGI